MSASSPDLQDLLSESSDLDDIPSNVKINLIARAVGKHKEDTNKRLDQVSNDVSTIKNTIQSAVGTARLLIIAVPIIAVLFSGGAWLLLHVTVK